MKTVYELFIPGVPKAQPRPRMTKTGHVYTPDSAKAWKEAIMAECMARCKNVITQPVKLTVRFFFPVPKNKKKECNIPHAKKPDVDNLLKAVMDAMTAAKVWKDDALVYSSSADKWYGTATGAVKIIVEVMEG